MYLSQMLLEMILPCKPVGRCPHTRCKSAVMLFHTQMRFLMSEELEFTVVGAGASVNSTREASKAEEVRYLSSKEGGLNIPLSVKIVSRGSCSVSSWCFELYRSKMPYVKASKESRELDVCLQLIFHLWAIFGLSCSRSCGIVACGSGGGKLGFAESLRKSRRKDLIHGLRSPTVRFICRCGAGSVSDIRRLKLPDHLRMVS
jgi:hypothetical protein